MIKCSSDTPEFYDPELAYERMHAQRTKTKDYGLTKEEREMVKAMAEKLSENLKKGRIEW